MQKKVARLANGNKISWKVPLDWQVSPQKTWPAPDRKETLMARGVRDAKKAGSTSTFPSGPPPQYYSCLKPFNFGVRMGSGAFGLVWPTATTYPVMFLKKVFSPSPTPPY